MMQESATSTREICGRCKFLVPGILRYKEVAAAARAMLDRRGRFGRHWRTDILAPVVYALEKVAGDDLKWLRMAVEIAVLAGFLPLNLLGELVSIGTLLAFTVVCIGVIVLRKTRPDLPRPYRTPWVPWIPIAGAVICVAQTVLLPFDTWLRLFIWMAIGIAVYFLYGRRHSRLNQHD